MFSECEHKIIYSSVTVTFHSALFFPKQTLIYNPVCTSSIGRSVFSNGKNPKQNKVKLEFFWLTFFALEIGKESTQIQQDF